MSITIVMINGEAQVGKTTFAMDLEYLLKNKSETQIYVERYSFVGFLREFLELFAKIESGISGRGYEELKKTELFGHVGREWMIAMGKAFRDVDSSILAKVLEAKIIHEAPIEGKSIYIVENFGFLEELEYFTRERKDWRIIAIHLDARATRRYEHGERFDNDSRINLRHMCGYQNPSPEDIASLILGKSVEVIAPTTSISDAMRDAHAELDSEVSSPVEKTLDPLVL